jgi:MFS family permease
MTEPDELVMSSREIIFQPRMEPNEPGKLNIKRSIFISFAFLSALAALTYYNIAVPVILKKELIPEGFVFLGFIPRNSFIGFLMTIDNILAVTLQPFFASLSDRAKSKLGRRTPFIIIGVIGSALFFAGAPWLKVLSGFVSMLFFYNIFMAFYRSPALALIADYTEEKLRSSASGLQQLIANIGTIVAFGFPIIIGFFVSNEMDKVERDILISKIGFPLVSATMIICLIIFLFTINETPTGDRFLGFSKKKISIDSMNFEIIEDNETLDDSLDENSEKEKWSFGKIFTKEYRSIFFLLLAIFFWFSGFGAIEAFFSLLGTEYFLLDMDRTPLVGLVYPVSMIIASLPTGLIGKKLGRKPTIYLSLGVLIVTLSLISFLIIPVKSVVGLSIVMFVVGFFWMAIIVNTFPIIWRLCPADEISTFTGIYYTFNQAAAIFGPIAMGLIFDLVEGSWGVDKYKLLYPFVLACVVFALLFLIPVKGTEPLDQSTEDIVSEIAE